MLLTPLPAKVSSKIGIEANTRIIAVNPPENYPALLSGLPEGVRFIGLGDNKAAENIHIFVQNREELFHSISVSKSFLDKEGKLWIFFPKRTSRIRTDIDFDFLLHFAKDSGMTNVQLTDIDIMWSGMEFTRDNSGRFS